VLDRKDIHGNLFELINQCENFFLRNMKTAAKAVGFRTEHKTEYPIDALKEALINALVHRDYFEKENILIRMFDNRIEIISLGELLRPLTIENLENLDYKPKSRNKVITKVLLRKGIMDERGSGILRIERAMEKWELEKPNYAEKDGYFVITFKGPSRAEKPLDEEILRGLNERQKKAAEYLREKGRITRSEYINICDSKISPRTALNDLQKMVKMKIIALKGEKKAAYYIIKS